MDLAGAYKGTTYIAAPTIVGTLPLLIGRKLYPVKGGPYEAIRTLKGDVFGVKLERSAQSPASITFPIQDFGVPQDHVAFKKALWSTLRAVLSGRQVFVGCMGGKGRTGLFMACLAKAAGMEHPVQHVRTFYYSGAVETKAQEQFVDSLDLGWMHAKLRFSDVTGCFFLAPDPA